MSSDSVEEYLEAIYAFNERGEPAKNTELARRLKVSPPSVTQMMKRLAEEGLVEYKPYRGATLTGKGTALAQKVVRKHRLLERFLHDFLGLRRNRVHEEACRLEHSLSDETAAALCKALNNPETCPDDGNPIPPCILDVAECEQCTEAREREGRSFKLVTQLSNLKPGEEGVVAFIRGGTMASQRLLDMGLTLRTRVRVLNAAPFRGPIEVAVRSSTLALGRRLAGHIFVEIEDDSPAHGRIHPHGPHHGRERRGWRR
ncbi:MAG: metal-dependent transcriptional regulator [Candidatus Bathyarchaeota archaeon]|nr:metal-dependent transcriptional regulator [Candidatus Bathyarchaeota archaeon]